jgi:uncharacterized tellurite resistance protein B-like protein
VISRVKGFFDRYITPAPGNADTISEHSLQIATAALLIEMMRADAEITKEELRAVKATIQSRFSLSREETESIIELAEEEIWQSTGYFEFTSLINRSFTHEEKIKVIEYLWEIAYADHILDKHEEYMVRKISGLIHVSHRDFIDAKLRVKKTI